jgi:nucleotide-binding universal stress UspA family protein
VVNQSTSAQTLVDCKLVMSQLVDQSSPGVAIGAGRKPSRPVLLGTLSVRVDPPAERMAIETALELGSRLILANMLRLPPFPCTVGLARDCATLPHEEDLEEVRATAQRAAELGIPTQLLRVSSPRPVTALIELAQDSQAGLLVFGPDRSRISRRRFKSAAQAVRRDAPCLVWIAD